MNESNQSFVTNFYYGMKCLTNHKQWNKLMNSIQVQNTKKIDFSNLETLSDVYKVIEYLGNTKRKKSSDEFEKKLQLASINTPASEKKEYIFKLINYISSNLTTDHDLFENYMTSATGLNRNIYEAQDFRENVRELKTFLSETEIKVDIKADHIRLINRVKVHSK